MTSPAAKSNAFAAARSNAIPRVPGTVCTETAADSALISQVKDGFMQHLKEQGQKQDLKGTLDPRP
eukprot:2835548-Rhodomonas_salina.1